MKSLKLGYDTQNHHYLTHLLSKEGLSPDPKYSGSPHYLKAWAMAEAGRLLGLDGRTRRLGLKSNIMLIMPKWRLITLFMREFLAIAAKDVIICLLALSIR